MNVGGSKRRRLNYSKCKDCRKDKKRCDPPDRLWPQKCHRCENMGLECSENINLKATKSDLGPAADGASPEKIDNLEDKESHDLIECEKWELELSWLHRCTDYISRLNVTAKTSDLRNMIFDFSEFELGVQERKNMISEEVSQLLQSPSALVRQAASSVVSRVISYRPSDYTDIEPVESEKTLEALLEGCKMSGRIDNELTVRECLLRAMATRDAHPEDMIDAVRHYIEACKSYMVRIKHLEELQGYYGLDPGKVSFPFNGDTRILSLLTRHFPTFSLEGLDIWGNNTLQALLWTADQKDIDQIIPTMDSGDFLHTATDLGYGAQTILHVAVARNIRCVVEKVGTLDRAGIDSIIHVEDEYNQTPLFVATAYGNCGIVGALLELGADPEARDHISGNALHVAARNGHKDITQLLLSHNSSLCTAGDWKGYTPFHDAIDHGHLEVAKLFPPESATMLGNGHKTPLHIASERGHVPIMSWLLDERDAGSINQKDRYGKTPLKLAADAGKLDAVNFLLSRGADATIRDWFGDTPYDVAQRHRNREMISALESVSLLARSH